METTATKKSIITPLDRVNSQLQSTIFQHGHHELCILANIFFHTEEFNDTPLLPLLFCVRHHFVRLSFCIPLTWQQNVMEYWWKGTTSTVIPSTSTSDTLGQHNKKGGITFRAALLISNKYLLDVLNWKKKKKRPKLWLWKLCRVSWLHWEAAVLCVFQVSVPGLRLASRCPFLR